MVPPGRAARAWVAQARVAGHQQAATALAAQDHSPQSHLRTRCNMSMDTGDAYGVCARSLPSDGSKSSWYSTGTVLGGGGAVKVIESDSDAKWCEGGKVAHLPRLLCDFLRCRLFLDFCAVPEAVATAGTGGRGALGGRAAGRSAASRRMRANVRALWNTLNARDGSLRTERTRYITSW